MSTSVSLAEVQARLGEEVTFIFLEPAEIIASRLAAGKEAELWGFDLATGQIRRGDKKFHAAGVIRHPGGWYLAAIIEEPGVTAPAEGPHIVGHVIVDVNPRGLIRVRTGKGLSGEILEVKPSSLSKGDLDSSGRTADGLYEVNPQRLLGTIAIFRHDVEFADEEGMTPSAFVAASTDGRSICAVAKLFFAS